MKAQANNGLIGDNRRDLIAHELKMSSSEEEDEVLPNIDFSDDIGSDISSVASRSEGDSEEGSWDDEEWSDEEDEYSDESSSTSDSSTESDKLGPVVPVDDNKNPKIKQF